MLSPGTTAPAFELPNQDGEPVRFSDYDGRQVVLYFFPKAHTPGCTDEACAFRDAFDEFAARGVDVIGISTDPVEELTTFAEENDLPFVVLSDEDGEVAKSYGTFKRTEVEGQTYEIASRRTFLIDEDGVIERVYEDVTPAEHADQVLAGL